MKEEAFSRKDILERVEKWLAACEEESWLEEYNKVLTSAVFSFNQAKEKKGGNFFISCSPDRMKTGTMLEGVHI